MLRDKLKKQTFNEITQRVFFTVFFLGVTININAAGSRDVFGLNYSQVANLMKAISGVLIFVGAFKVFWMMEHGDRGVSKTIILIIGGCVAIMAMINIIPRMFGI